MFKSKSPVPVDGFQLNGDPSEYSESVIGVSIADAEAHDPHMLRKMAEAIARIVHSDEHIPKGMDNIGVLLSMAFNGESLLVRRAATIEMAAFLRRQGTALKSYQQAIHDQAHIISDKAQDFPQAKEINDKCQDAFASVMGNINGRMTASANLAYDDDVAEALGLSDFVRDQVARSIPGRMQELHDFGASGAYGTA